MLKNFHFIAIFFVLSSILEFANCQLPKLKQIPDPRLRRRLLDGYDRYSIPLSDQGKGTILSLPSLTITHFDIREVDQMFEIDAWLQFMWHDTRLKWEYGDDSGSLHFNPEEIWIPDLTLYNSGTPDQMFIWGKSDCLVQANGTIMWVPPFRMSAYCKLDLLKWPRDTQKCILKFGSWTYSEPEIDLEFGTDTGEKVKIYEEYTVDNTEWDIIDTNAFRESKKYNCCAENYVSITYEFTLIRKSNNYSFTICLPVALFSVLNLLCFFLPIASGERITLGGINLIVNSIFLVFFRMKLPATDHVPYIVMFYGWNLILATINILTTIILINISKFTRKDEIPKYFQAFTSHKLVAFLRLTHLQEVKADHGKEGGVENVNHPNCNKDTSTGNTIGEDLILSFTDDTTQDQDIHGIQSKKPATSGQTTAGADRFNWTLLSAVFDRLSFVSYTIITLFLAIIFA